MWGIPVNQIPFKYYNGNQSVKISKLQGLRVTCNPHKFEIPALRFPRKDPVNPCKHLQCDFKTSYNWVFFKLVTFSSDSFMNPVPYGNSGCGVFRGFHLYKSYRQKRPNCKFRNRFHFDQNS